MELAHVLIVLLAAAAAGSAMALYYEGLSLLNRWLPRLGRQARPRVLALVFALLLLHVIEIGLFGLALYGAAAWDLGTVRSDGAFGLWEAAYLSAQIYTTLGMGDFVLAGPMRLLVGLESLTGLMLIAWSGWFTYLEMERDWRR